MSRRKKTSPLDDPMPDAVTGADDESPEDIAAQAAAAIASATLTGDLRDFILDRLRYEQNKRPWDERSQAEQEATVSAVEAAVSHAVDKAVHLIAAAGMPTISATVEQVTIKDGIKATFTLLKTDPRRHALVDAQGSRVLIVVADADPFIGESKPVDIKPDQAALALQATMVEHSGDDADEAAEMEDDATTTRQPSAAGFAGVLN